MKKYIFMLFLALITVILPSCSSDKEVDDDKPKKYPFAGFYVNYNHRTGEINELVTLQINDDQTFTHTDAEYSYWRCDGTWTYDKDTNIIRFHYLVETTDKGMSFIYDDFCFGQPFNNYKNLRFKEYEDDKWENYGWFVKS